jgi:hypothetical protein
MLAPVGRLAVFLAMAVAFVRADVDPVGRYELTTTMRGKATSLVATIAKQPDGSLGGELSGNSINTVKIVDIRVSDSTVKFAVDASQDARANFTMIVSGNKVTGEWSMPGDASSLEGRRVAP